MKALYIASTESFRGKTALCVGLGLRFQDEGLRVGYLKPVNTGVRRMRRKPVDEDAEFIKKVLGLQEPAESLSPVSLDASTVTAVLQGEDLDLETRLRDGFHRSAEGKDVVLLEGGGGLSQGALVGLAPHRVAELIDAKALVIARYEEILSLDGLLGYRELLGGRMLGAVLNEVPRQDLDPLRELALPYLENRGISTFALLPRERVLQSISVDQLAHHLGAKILNSEEKREELVYSFMIGAMGADRALSYFRRQPNKAVVTGGDRPDIQLAALETSTTCIILTGNLSPSPTILGRAKEKGIPLLLASQDTLGAVQIIEQFFGKTRFHQEAKIERFRELLRDHFDFDRLKAALEI